MSAIEESPRAMDYAVQVVHDALRVHVMGERAVAGEAATEADIAEMRALTREALLAGAVGFSTGRTDNHRANDGSPTPASEASERELVGIASALAGLGHGVFQAVSDFDMSESRARFDGELDLLERMVEAAPGHALSISLMQRQGDSEQWKRIVSRVETASRRGLPIKLQVAARGIGVILGLEATFHPLLAFPSYADIETLPLPERVARMRDPAFKARLLAEKPRAISGDGSSVPPLADQLLQAIDFVAAQLFRLGETPDYEPKRETSIYAEALARGVSSLDAIYDALLEDDGRRLLYFPIYNYMEGNLDAVHTMLTHPLALAGLGDGGAHVGTICDASFPTYMLMHWARDRERRLDLPHVVRMLTRNNARHMGFADRGTIEVGAKADLNVIDHERLAIHRPHLAADLPAGGKRFLQRAKGYVATLVSGEVVLERDELTGARPGRLVQLAG